MDASEYKHPVLGLIFLKYISDAFEEKHAQLARDPDSDPEDRDEYIAESVFWVPPDARWSQIAAKAKSPRIGEILDKAMIASESATEQVLEQAELLCRAARDISPFIRRYGMRPSVVES